MPIVGPVTRGSAQVRNPDAAAWQPQAFHAGCRGLSECRPAGPDTDRAAAESRVQQADGPAAVVFRQQQRPASRAACPQQQPVRSGRISLSNVSRTLFCSALPEAVASSRPGDFASARREFGIGRPNSPSTKQTNVPPPTIRRPISPGTTAHARQRGTIDSDGGEAASAWQQSR